MENNENRFGRDDQKPERERRNRNFASHERSFNKDRKSFHSHGDGEERSHRQYNNDRPRFHSENGERHSFHKFDGENSERREFKPRRFDNERPRRKFDNERPRFNFEKDEHRSFHKFDGENSERRDFKPRRFDNERPRRKFDNERPRFNSDNDEHRSFHKFDGENSERREFKPRRFNDRPFKKSFQKSYENPTEYTQVDKNLVSRNYDDDWNDEIVLTDYEIPEQEVLEEKHPATEAEGYRLNRFISAAGVCSRRDADDYIAAGRITLNGNVVTDFSTKVFPNDVVCLDGKKLTSQKRVYIVFNKPKDCISTKSDDLGRRTIFDYVKTDVEVKNVGRLDRDTTGVMLLTNDGDLIERLTHPRYNKMKIYHVFLNKNLSPEDLETIRNGVELQPLQSEDGSEIKGGFIDVDDLQYVDGEKNQVGIQIHSGLYHVVRRIFDQFGYTVEKLDRVYFAGLTKKDLPRGRWRYLTPKEVSILKRGAYA